VRGKWKRICDFDWQRNIEYVHDSVKCENTPNVFLTLKEKIANEDAEAENINELCLEEFLDPVPLKDVNVFQGEEQ